MMEVSPLQTLPKALRLSAVQAVTRKAQHRQTPGEPISTVGRVDTFLSASSWVPFIFCLPFPEPDCGVIFLPSCPPFPEYVT